MEYLGRDECLAKLRDYIYSGKKILKAPELTPNFLSHVYELMSLEKSLFISGGLLLDNSGKPVHAARIAYESFFSMLAPVNFQMWLFPFMFNIFKKYGNYLMFLIHQDANIEQPLLIDIDPFLEDQMDPSSTLADKSSLWELDLLTHHFYPKISSFTKILSENFKGRLAFPLEKYTKKTAYHYFEDTLSSARDEKQGYDYWPMNQEIPRDIFSF